MNTKDRIKRLEIITDMLIDEIDNISYYRHFKESVNKKLKEVIKQ